jgi:hypothetical protein
MASRAIAEATESESADPTSGDLVERRAEFSES